MSDRQIPVTFKIGQKSVLDTLSPETIENIITSEGELLLAEEGGSYYFYYSKAENSVSPIKTTQADIANSANTSMISDRADGFSSQIDFEIVDSKTEIDSNKKVNSFQLAGDEVVLTLPEDIYLKLVALDGNEQKTNNSYSANDFITGLTYNSENGVLSITKPIENISTFNIPVLKKNNSGDDNCYFYEISSNSTTYLRLTLVDNTHIDIPVPAADDNFSGLVNLLQQSFKGKKTFLDGISSNNKTITDVATPINTSDAANKDYVDNNKTLITLYMGE